MQTNMAQGRETVTRKTHYLEIEGSIPSPATSPIRSDLIQIAILIVALGLIVYWIVRDTDKNKHKW